MSLKSVRKVLIIGAVVVLPLTVCSQFPGGGFPGGVGGFQGGGFPGGGFPGGGFGGFPGGGGFMRPVIPEVMQLTITTKSGNIILKSTSNVAEINVKKGKMTDMQMIDMKTVVVYVDKNETFYIPRNILSLIQSQQAK